MRHAGERRDEHGRTVQSDPRWAAVCARDARADGSFVYSVESTGVYCHPSCASRAKRPEHVAFHASAAQAERAGYRACKRCRPDQPPPRERRAALVAALCRWIVEQPREPTLEQLAAHAGLSPFYLQRTFKAVLGLTPKAYAAAERAAQLRTALTREATVTGAIFAAGYGSTSRFYEQAEARLGMTPTAYRHGGAELALRFAVAACWLGAILVAATERGVCAVLLGDEPEALVRDLERRFPRAQLIGADRDFERWVAQVIGLVEAPEQGTLLAQLPLDLRGTAFQQRVWQALSAIPAGQTTTYSRLAQAIGAPSSARAVAQACGQNPLAVAVPCHRVVRMDGSLSGYRWGIERKRALLEREAQR